MDGFSFVQNGDNDPNLKRYTFKTDSVPPVRHEYITNSRNGNVISLRPMDELFGEFDDEVQQIIRNQGINSLESNPNQLSKQHVPELVRVNK